MNDPSKRSPDIEMLFRVGGPAWKAIRLLLDGASEDEPAQLISGNKALQVCRDLALGNLTEEQVDSWVHEVYSNV